MTKVKYEDGRLRTQSAADGLTQYIGWCGKGNYTYTRTEAARFPDIAAARDFCKHCWLQLVETFDPPRPVLRVVKHHGSPAHFLVTLDLASAEALAEKLGFDLEVK